MTAREYITERFRFFGIQVSEADLLDMSTTVNLDANISENDLLLIKKEICKFIPTVLAFPNISQGGVSISRNVSGITSYYNSLCKELGIISELSPKTTFIRL
ncbi:MAG: DUF6706 family protein [Rikenellaceae bacterium]